MLKALYHQYYPTRTVIAMAVATLVAKNSTPPTTNNDKVNPPHAISCLTALFVCTEKCLNVFTRCNNGQWSQICFPESERSARSAGKKER